MISKRSAELLLNLFAFVLFISLINLFPLYLNAFAAENLDRYWSVLTGDQKIPPINTRTVGLIALKFQDDVSRLVYIVNIENIKNVTGVNLYHGNNDQNGTIVLNLLNGTRELRKNVDKLLNVSEDGRMTGTLTIGGATQDDLQGTLKGKSLSDLHQLVDNGTIYVDIDTKQFHYGEIRGDRFIGIDRLFPDFTDFKWK